MRRKGKTGEERKRQENKGQDTRRRDKVRMKRKGNENLKQAKRIEKEHDSTASSPVCSL